MQKPQGLEIQFQGYPCLPLFQYSRSVGLEPDFGFVHLERADFRNFHVRDSADSPQTKANYLHPLATREKTPAPTPKGDGLLSQGDLVVTERIDGELHTVTFNRVLVSERAIESVVALDDPNDVVRVELSDIRYLWGRRGVVFGWINVPRQDDGKAAGAASSLHTSSAPLARGAQLPPLIEGSLRGGAPWTLKQVLVERVLPALPGAPPLKRMPKDLEDAIPLGHVWDGYPAKHALSDLLDEFHLRLALNLDASVSLWREDEGALQLDSGVLVDLEHDERVSSQRSLVSFYHLPAVVLVLGSPIRETAHVGDLEPVGESGGELLPLTTALAKIGLTSEQEARLFATCTHDERSTYFHVTADGIREFERWAFKWYRLPGGTKENANRLPIEDRGDVDEIGQFLPPRVWSESIAVTRTATLLLQAVKGKEARAKAFDAVKAGNTDQLLAVWNVPYAEQTSGFSLDRARGIVRFDAIQGTISQEGASLKEGFLKRYAHVAIEFGFDRKPALNEDVQLRHRYHAIFVRDGKGGVRAIGELPGNAAPLVIERPDFLQVIALNGTTNKPLLDGLAAKLAQDVFRQPAETVGGIVQLHRPLPLVNTGLVRSIVWSTEADVPRVVAHVGALEPLAPTPEPVRTRARSGPLDVLRGSVIVPRGLRP